MIKPLFDNILLDVHKSAFTAMNQVDEKEANIEKATILAIGEEVTTLKVGNVIYFKDYATDCIIEDDKKYILIPEKEIKALFV